MIQEQISTEIMPLENMTFLLKELKDSKANILTVYEQFISSDDIKPNSLSIRIDVDNGLACAVAMAEAFAEINVKASFYFLTATANYSIYNNAIKHIHSLGHEIGLHSDHNYLEKRFGLNGLLLLKQDVEILSGLIGEKIKGMCFHGHSEIDKIQFQGNWYLYRNLNPKDLGLEYHDGPNGPYCKQMIANIWEPPVNNYISDFPYAWRDETQSLKDFFNKIKTGKDDISHLVIHPANFYEPQSWKNNEHNEMIVPLRIIKKGKYAMLKKIIRKALNIGIGFCQKISFWILTFFMHIIGNKKNHGHLAAIGKADSIEDFIAVINSGNNNYNKIIEKCNFNTSDTVLDIGFGAGQFLIKIAGSVRSIYGIEPNEELFNYVQKRVEEEKFQNVEISKSYGEKLSYNNDKFDKVLCLSVIMMVEPITMLKEINRVLKPGGTAVFHVSDIGYAMHCIRDGVYCKEQSRMKIGLNLIFNRLRRRILRKSTIGGVMNKKDFELLATEAGMETVSFENISYYHWEPKTFWGFNRQLLIVLKKKS